MFELMTVVPLCWMLYQVIMLALVLTRVTSSSDAVWLLVANWIAPRSAETGVKPYVLELEAHPVMEAMAVICGDMASNVTLLVGYEYMIPPWTTVRLAPEVAVVMVMTALVVLTAANSGVATVLV